MKFRNWSNDNFLFKVFSPLFLGGGFKYFLFSPPTLRRFPFLICFGDIFKLGSNHQIVVGDSIRCGQKTAYGSEVFQMWDLILW